MELILFGEEGHLNYMFNFFVNPSKLNLYRIYEKIHISVNPYNCLTANKDGAGKIRYITNQKVVVLTRIPNSLTRFFWKNAGEVKFEEETLKINRKTLCGAEIDHPEIIKSIMKEDNIQMRRDFIAILKILSTPVDFPIIIDEIMVRRPTPGAKSIFDDLEELPVDKIFGNLVAKHKRILLS